MTSWGLPLPVAHSLVCRPILQLAFLTAVALGGEGASLTCISSGKENACLHAKKNHLNAALRTVEHGFFTTRAKVTVKCDHHPSLMCDLQTRVLTLQDTTHTHNNYAGHTSFLLLLLHLLVLLLADTTLQVGAWSAQ